MTGAVYSGGLVAVAIAFHVPSAKSENAYGPMSIPEVQRGLENKDCRESDFVNVKDLGSTSIVSVDFDFPPQSKEFRGRTRNVYDIRELLRADAEFLRKVYHDLATAQVPSGIDQYKLSDFQLAAPGDGTLHGSFYLEYQQRASATVTCYDGWNDWPPYPKFKACDWITDVPGMHAAGIVHTVATPKLTTNELGESQLSVDMNSTYEEKERPSELLINIVGIFSFSIGGKYINDVYRGNVSDFRAKISAGSYALVTLPKIRKSDPSIDLVMAKPAFVAQGGKLQLALEATSSESVTPTTVELFRDKVTQAQRFFQSCANPKTNYEVQQGDTLWSVAESVYGDGQYYQIIKAANTAVSDNPDILRVGQALTLPPYYKLVTNKQVLVQSGDTLWGIAEKVLGDGRLYKNLGGPNGEKLADTKNLATLTVISVPK
jgi:LysM repeat protein